MTEWLAIVVFCVGENCAFWAKTDEPYKTEGDCIAMVLEAEAKLVQNGATSTLSTCIPIKWVKV
jgi:hypothetical protein